MSRAIQSPHRSARRQTISRKSIERRTLNGGRIDLGGQEGETRAAAAAFDCLLSTAPDIVPNLYIFAGKNNKTRRETRRRRQIHINSPTYYYRIWSRPDSRIEHKRQCKFPAPTIYIYSLANRDWSAIKIWYRSIWNGHTKFPINDNKSARNISCVSLFIYSLARITGQIY